MSVDNGDTGVMIAGYVDADTKEKKSDNAMLIFSFITINRANNFKYMF